MHACTCTPADARTTLTLLSSSIFIFDTQEDEIAGLEEDLVPDMSPLRRITEVSNKKATRVQEDFTKRLQAIYTHRQKITKMNNISVFGNMALREGFLEYCEGEGSAIAQGLRNKTSIRWQRTWASLTASKLILFDPHTQDLVDPFEAIQLRSILSCKAEDTCVFSVESMVDDFLGSWSFFFRTESRAERDFWIQALDQQVCLCGFGVAHAAPRGSV